MKKRCLRPSPGSRFRALGPQTVRRGRGEISRGHARGYQSSRLRPHLHAALRSLADNRPKNAALAVSDFLGSNREDMPLGNSNAVGEEPASDEQAGGTSAGVDGDEVVE